jgi:hypothetical protein
MCKTWGSIRIGIEIESRIRIGFKNRPQHWFLSMGIADLLSAYGTLLLRSREKILGQARFKMMHRERIVEGKKQ